MTGDISIFFMAFQDSMHGVWSIRAFSSALCFAFRVPDISNSNTRIANIFAGSMEADNKFGDCVNNHERGRVNIQVEQ